MFAHRRFVQAPLSKHAANGIRLPWSLVCKNDMIDDHGRHSAGSNTVVVVVVVIRSARFTTESTQGPG